MIQEPGGDNRRNFDSGSGPASGDIAGNMNQVTVLISGDDAGAANV